MIDVHFGWKLKDIKVEKTVNGYDRFAFFTDEKGSEVRLRFGSLLLTPDNKKRAIYEGNDLANEHVINKFIMIIGRSHS